MNDIEQTGRMTAQSRQDKRARILASIKLVHSAVWLVMVTCILLIPWTAFEGRVRISAMLTGVILIESVVLFFNRGKCPLTSIAEHYTEDRADNFDIYLPLWLARHNKKIFGALFVCGASFALLCWLFTK